jgi:hypothetical protein
MAAALAGEALHKRGDRRVGRKTMPGKDPIAQHTPMPAMQALDADHACGAGTGLPGRACGHGLLETQHLREILASSGYADSRFGVLLSRKVGYPPISGTVFRA